MSFNKTFTSKDILLNRQIDEMISKQVKHKGADDIEITDSGKGFILTASNGTRWRLTVDGSGVVSSTQL